MMSHIFNLRKIVSSKTAWLDSETMFYTRRKRDIGRNMKENRKEEKKETCLGQTFYVVVIKCSCLTWNSGG